jgi:hypothetical protein
MGLFGSREPLDALIARLWVRPHHHGLVKEMEKELARSQAAILTNSSPQTNPLTCVAVGWKAGAGRDGVLAVTAQRVLKFEREKVSTSLKAADVVQLKLGESPNGFAVVIYTRTALFDYQPDDPRRFDHAIVMHFPSMRIAGAVDREIRSIAPACHE